MGLGDTNVGLAGGDDFDRALAAAKSFHLRLVDIVGNRRLYSILETLVEEVQRLHYLLPGIADHVTSAEELRAHQQIAEAIGAGKADAAAQFMLDHLNEAARTLINGFSGT